MRKENFDESVKHILEQTEFAYDPAAWEQAQALLAQESSPRLGGWWWTMLFVAVSGIVGAGISGISEHSETPEQSRLTATSADSPTAQPASAAASDPINTTELDDTAIPTATDTSAIVHKKVVRLLHPEPAPLVADTSEMKQSESLFALHSRAAGLLPNYKYRLDFSPALRQVPAFDFKYETRPAATQRQSGFAAFGWAGQQGRNTESTRLQQQYGFGFSGYFELLPRFAVQLGGAIGYNNGFAYSSQRSDTTYGFGRTITTQTAIARDYLQLQLPVGLQYRFAEKHHIEAGMAYHWYVGSRYRLLTDVQKEDGSSTNTTTEMNGKITGIQIQPWSWYAGYRFQITDAFDLGIRYQQQRAGASSFPAEKSFRIVLHYNLYRFTL